MDTSREERRNRVMIGALPDDFLRVPNSQNTTAVSGDANRLTYLSGNLKITVMEAQMAKNYGLAKMDPYVRLRIGHNVYETHADLRGGKHPSWNRTFHTYLPQGIRTIFFDVYDERALIPDERIAWGNYNLPDELFRGEYVDCWADLTGKLGEGKEGKVHVGLSFSAAAVQPPNVGYPSAPVMVMPTPYYNGYSYFPQCAPIAIPQVMPYPPQVNSTCSQQQQQLQNTQPADDQIQQLQEMFPSFDKEVIISVFQSCGQNKDQTVNALLAMNG